MLQFINKIRSFFAEEDITVVLPKESVPFSELHKWLEKHTSQITRSVLDQATPLLDKLDDILFAVSANLTKLEHAELRNRNISSRELEIMKGNRSSYIHRTQHFLAALILFSEKETKTYSDMKQLMETYRDQFEQYHDATLKPYAVLQHFFANETYAVAKNVKEIDEVMKQIQHLLQKQSIEALTDIMEQITFLEQKFAEQKKLLAQKKELDEESQRLEILQQQAFEKQKKVEGSEGHKKYLKLLEKAKEQEKGLQEHCALLSHSFAIIDKAIRKYVRLFPEQEAFLAIFLENPIAAVQTDTSFTIATILHSVKEQLLTDSLDIKDDKKEKTLLELDRLDIGFFENFLKLYVSLEAEKRQYDTLCAANFSKQEYKEAEYMYTTYKEKAAAVQKESDSVRLALELLSLSLACQQLQTDIRACTKQEIEIVYPDQLIK